MKVKLLAEFIGTAGLLVAVIGSGIMGERLADGNIAIALLANTLATVFALYILIETFGPLSGAHFNPVVSLVMRLRGELTTLMLVFYILAQLCGAVLGAWLAHVMFEMEILQFSAKARSGLAQFCAEIIATFGLLFVILRAPAAKVSSMVAAYIGAAYWFTASTSFANPAAAFGRMFSDSFAGIAPADVPAFMTAEVIGGVLALLLHQFFRAHEQPDERQR